MKDELKKTFENCLKQFEKDESINMDFKKILMENIGLEKELFSFISQFHEIALKNNYAYSIALSYAFIFYIYISTDIDKAMVYNEKARELFLEQDDFKEKEGILTVANNAVLGHIAKKDYFSAYKEIMWALPIAQKCKNLTYFTALANNGAIILNEFGLYKKAIQQVQESLLNKDLIGKSAHFTNIYVLVNLYLKIKDTKKVYELLDENIETMLCYDTYDGNIFYKQYMEAAILDQDRDKADYYYQLLINNYDFSRNDELDNNEVRLSLGHYYTYIKDYNKAQEYFDIILKDPDKLLGHKQTLLESVAQLYYEKGEYRKAYDYINELKTNMQLYMSFIDDLYRLEIDDVWEKMRMQSYEVLFERLLDITEFGKIVVATLTLNEVFDVVHQRIPGIFTFDDCDLFLFDERKNLIYKPHFKSIDIRESHLLQNCIYNQKVMSFGHILPQSETAKELYNLCDVHTRSIFIQPIVYKDSVLAILCMKSKQFDAFSRTDQGLLQVSADYIAIALENVMKFEDIIEKTSYDYLTGIYNRSALMQHGEQILKDARDQHFSIGALMIDIDDFKKVNDTYGHMQGDMVIQNCTSIMERLKKHGTIARFGGEEFILLINNITKDELYQLAEEIRYETENSIVKTQKGNISYTVSIGCSYQNVATSSLHTLFQMADQRLYVAKRNGKNYVQM